MIDLGRKNIGRSRTKRYKAAKVSRSGTIPDEKSEVMRIGRACRMNVDMESVEPMSIAISSSPSQGASYGSFESEID